MLHSHKSLPYTLAVLFFLLMQSPTLADTNPRDQLNAGIQAAKEGRYQQALNHFLKAQKAGLDTPGLSYNLAVTYYRLSEYQKARELFLTLARKPKSRQLAYFNLGLVTNRQNNEAEAVKWFRQAYRSKGEPRIQAMAAEALKRLGVRPQPKSSWNGFARTGLMYDSNVTLANDTLTGITRTSDTAAELIASASGWLTGNRRGGLQLSTGGYLLKYQTQNRNDFSQLNASLGRYDLWGDWQTRVYVRWEESFFGGASYQRAISLDNRAQRPLGKANRLQLRYKLSRLQPTNSRFDYLDGWRHQLRLGNQWRRQGKSLKTYYQLELNDRQDRISPVSDRFTSFSPIRHALRARAGLDLGAHWRASLDGRYRYSRYRGENDLSGGVTKRRIDQQYRTNLSLRRKLSRRWEFDIRYSYTRNDSRITSYRYRRHQVSASINGYF